MHYEIVPARTTKNERTIKKQIVNRSKDVNKERW